jgi:hypothetical protein
MEDIGRFSDLRQDRKRPIKGKHILAILMDGAVRSIACRSFIADARYWKDSIIARHLRNPSSQISRTLRPKL